jgi:hypothetical protein
MAKLLALAFLATLVLAAHPGLSPPPVLAQPSTSVSGLHAAGNQLVNGAGQAVQLHGVNRSGAEYACIQGWGIFDGPADAASVQAIASWHTNAVRVPLNEDCWLAINGAPAAYSGANYQQAITNYVNLLTSNGLAAILDLHWNAPGTTQATGQQPMADRDHAPAFWSSVAGAFKGNSAILFDLYNEPYPDSNRDTTAAWTCWRDGGACSGVSFTAAGMQELVTSVRNAGAGNVILLGGVEYAGSLSQWLTYKPTDPLSNIAASVHHYNFGGCVTTSCYDTNDGPVAAQVPLVAGEIGENDCASTYIGPLMSWFDSHQQSYLAWTWDTWGTNCGAIALISNYNGTPATAYGQGYQAHLAALAAPSPCANATLTSDAPPSPIRPGTPVHLTANATCGGTPVYEWWLGIVGASAWTWQLLSGYQTANTFTWNTSGLAPGSYVVDVWVENQGGSPTGHDTYAYLTFSLTTACSNATLAANPPAGSVPLGSVVQFTAGAACGGTPAYEWWLGTANGGAWSWQLLTGYRTANTYSWNTSGLAPGTYIIDVWVENQGGSAVGYDTYAYQWFSLYRP